jgi:DNA invertase Pin-like site-specific DNA recombinase
LPRTTPFLDAVAALAQLERGQISERTMLALAHKRANGQRVSGMIPYGYRLADDGVTLAEAPEEQAAVAMVQQMRTRGYSTRRIGSELMRRGIRPRCGTHWHPKVIMCLCRPAFAEVPT